MALYTDPPSVYQTVGVIPTEHGRLHKFFDAHLTDDGLTTGEENIIGDYTTPDIFYWTAVDTIRIYEMNLIIEDSAVAADKYGNLTALTNGIFVRHYDADFAVLETFNDLAIKDNASWAMHADTLTEHTFGAGNNFIVANWHFSTDGTALRIETGEHFGVAVADNLTGLVKHQFVIQGLHEDLYD